jgi:urease accessory protein
MGTIIPTATATAMTETRQPPDAGIDPRLWMLVSPALPVGGYSYSQGLEQAIGAGWIDTARHTQTWILDLLLNVLVPVDLAHLLRLQQAIARSDRNGIQHWNSALLACRESAELRKEDRDMGAALVRLLSDLGFDSAGLAPVRPAFATAFALAGRALDLSPSTLLTAYAWVWCENQVAAAIKLVPLGQTEGQRILLTLAGELDLAVQRAEKLEDGDLGATAPALSIASAAHETQHTRLFRS